MHVNKNKPGILELWWGGDALYHESDLYFQKTSEVKEYVQNKFKGLYKGKTLDLYFDQPTAGNSNHIMITIK